MKAARNIEDKLLEVKDKLEQLGIEEGLVNEIEWCLGSYSYDKNPSGLIEKAGAALKVLSKVKKENEKKVSRKLITDLERIVNSK